MTDPVAIDKFIKCVKCHCKYFNDDEHIKTDFGFTRLGQRYKSCVKCRERGKQSYQKTKK